MGVPSLWAVWAPGRLTVDDGACEARLRSAACPCNCSNLGRAGGREREGVGPLSRCLDPFRPESWWILGSGLRFRLALIRRSFHFITCGITWKEPTDNHQGSLLQEHFLAKRETDNNLEPLSFSNQHQSQLAFDVIWSIRLIL